jgi:hypothetical protein
MSNFAKLGIVALAANRSKTEAEMVRLRLETRGLCWVDYHYSGVCPQKGKRLNSKTDRAAHKVAHSRGGDDCVAMCNHCNAEQGTLPLEEYELILKHRYAKLQKNNASKPLDKGTDSS